MRKFIPKQRWQNVVFSKFTAILMIIVLFFTGNATWNMYKKYTESKMNKINTLSKLSELEKRKSVLLDDINRLDTDRGIEEELRKNFSIVKDGEELIVIIDNPELKKDTKVSESTYGFWSKILNLFK